MKNKGAYSSVEAILSLLILLAVFLSAPATQEPSLERLYLLQKEHDLLKLWAKRGIPSRDEMIADFEFAFPGKSGEIRVNESLTSIGKLGKEAVSAEMVFFDSKMNRVKVSVLVFK